MPIPSFQTVTKQPTLSLEEELSTLDSELWSLRTSLYSAKRCEAVMEHDLAYIKEEIRILARRQQEILIRQAELQGTITKVGRPKASITPINKKMTRSQIEVKKLFDLLPPEVRKLLIKDLLKSKGE